MNILGCLDRPDRGQLPVHGPRRLGRSTATSWRELRREAFGFVFQSYNLIATGSAAENVEMPAVYAGLPPAERHARASELLDALGLADRLAPSAEPAVGRPAAARLDRARADERRPRSSSPTSRPARSTARAAPT